MLAIGSYVDDGRFQIVDMLGKGGSGVAYLALDTLSPIDAPPRYYAIKAVPRSPSVESASLMREIRHHRAVSSHPGVVPLRRTVAHGGNMQLLIMDFLPGGDLFKQITQQHRYFMNDALITDTFLQIIDAVEYCHAQGVHHRDLKPENILCNTDGSRVYLADFGLATRQTVSDDLGVGSGYYMSPECNLGPSYSTAANDVWSLGVILSNLAYGRNPWAQALPTDPTFAAYMANPNYLTQILPVPAPVNEILRGVFALDPRRRWSVRKLREHVVNIKRWTLGSEEARYAHSEARSVLSVLKNCVRERELKGVVSPRPVPRAQPALSPASGSSSSSSDASSSSPATPAPPVIAIAPAPVTPAPAPTRKASKAGLRLMFSRFRGERPSTADSDTSVASDDSYGPVTPPVHGAIAAINASAGEFPFPMASKADAARSTRNVVEIVGGR